MSRPARHAEVSRRLVTGATVLGALAAFAAALPVAAAVDRIAPGLYRTTTTIAGMRAPSVREQCFTDAGITELISLPPTSAASGTCTTSRRVYAGGRIDIARSCTGAKGVTAGSITGSYSATAFTFRMQSRAPGLPSPLDVRVSAQRLSATCGADD